MVRVMAVLRQVQAAQGIVVAVAQGQLPRETGVQMLVTFFNIEATTAEQLMGDVGGSFTPDDEGPNDEKSDEDDADGEA